MSCANFKIGCLLLAINEYERVRSSPTGQTRCGNPIGGNQGPTQVLLFLNLSRDRILIEIGRKPSLDAFLDDFDSGIHLFIIAM
jgi:hypothetical protein